MVRLLCGGEIQILQNQLQEIDRPVILQVESNMATLNVTTFNCQSII